MNLREVTRKYCRIAAFARRDTAEIWGFSYGLKLGIGALKIMACTGVFVRIPCARKRSISCNSQTPSTILTRHAAKRPTGHFFASTINL
jgi:hypothetical protein